MLLIKQEGNEKLDYLSLENALEKIGFSCVSYYARNKPYFLTQNFPINKKLKISYTGIIPRIDFEKDQKGFYRTIIYTTNKNEQVKAISRTAFPIAKFITLFSSKK